MSKEILSPEELDKLSEKIDSSIEEFLQSELFATKLNTEQQEEIFRFISEMKMAMNKTVPGKFKLPKQYYLEALSSAITQFSRINLEAPRNSSCYFDNILSHCKGSLNYLRNIDNRIDEDVGNLLLDLYQRDDISVGIHGTVLDDDFDISPDNCDFFKHGIMVRDIYKSGDARRTVNFQDLPGKQWAFGYVSFLKLLSYSYQSRNAHTSNGNSKADYSCIVVRPSSMADTAYHADCPQEYSLVSPSTSIRTNDGHYLSGHLVKPEFILGIFKNNTEFVRNPKCNLEQIAALLKNVKILQVK